MSARPRINRDVLTVARARVTAALDDATGPMQRDQYALLLEAIIQECANRLKRLSVTRRGDEWRELFCRGTTRARRKRSR